MATLRISHIQVTWVKDKDPAPWIRSIRAYGELEGYEASLAQAKILVWNTPVTLDDLFILKRRMWPLN